jgi:dTDP-4-amino-4,6-dideoxygalactose transaminase
VSSETQSIEAFFRQRLGRDALYLPSARLGLYLVFREWLQPGDRLLMSPVNCDVVLFTALAAGLMPVLAPVDPCTGNIDPAAIDDWTWTSVHAVMTTNLYGIPDRMDLLHERCHRHGLLLIEDACHAFDSRFEGRQIGTFGSVAVFSLAKHVGGMGAIATFAEQSYRESLLRRAERELRSRALPQAAAARIREWINRLGFDPRASAAGATA